MIRKLLTFLTQRMVVVAALILLQIVELVLILLFLTRFFPLVSAGFALLSVLIVFYIASKEDNPSYKLAWIIPVLLFPLFGGFFYLIFGYHNVSPKVSKKIREVFSKTKDALPKNNDIVEKLSDISESASRQVAYITRTADVPLWQNTQVTYYSPGEELLPHLLEELEKAEHTIFLEYFIIQEGQMWDAVLEILVRKAKQGLDVRVMYDDLGSVFTLPSGYYKKLQALGIKAKLFNPIRPSLDAFMNYRDHRKILVIDNNVGFTGGINLADEYINAYSKHGYWKDCSIMLKGDAVWNLTVIFLRLWQESDDDPIDYNLYKPTINIQDDSFVIPFSDSPIDQELCGELAYINMINHAKRYVYIATPYLIIDNEMMTALCLAAKSGVDVRIVTPGIADKWYVHEVSRSNYAQLVKNGVHIYEYTPGFIHSKTLVADDLYAIVGTTNFDFRSFYLHFECGVWMYNSPCALQVRDDYAKILEVSSEITPAKMQAVPFWLKLLRSMLKLFSPLM